MNRDRLRSGLKRALKRNANRLRSVLPQDRTKLTLVAKPESAEKVARVIARLPFYVPGIDASAIPVVDALPVSEVLRGVVLVVDQELREPWARIFDNVFNVDFERNVSEGWELCELSSYVEGNPAAERRADSRRRLATHVAAVQGEGHDKCYVFGTGTSLERAIDRDFKDGCRIVCNTIVRDANLWHHLDPHFIVAGDAIYHFGFTEFARAFRRDLALRLAESRGRTRFVYPERYDTIVRRELQDCAELLIPIPLGVHDSITVDLLRNFELPPLSNVLNQLLLPLGCTISRSIHLWGFDGRAPDDKLFWSNSKRHSYPELMHTLLEAHPAFYETLVPKGREQSYVQSVHGDELDRRLSRAEAAGFTFTMMHESWTPTMQKRYRPVSLSREIGRK